MYIFTLGERKTCVCVCVWGGVVLTYMRDREKVCVCGGGVWGGVCVCVRVCACSYACVRER